MKPTTEIDDLLKHARTEPLTEGSSPEEAAEIFVCNRVRGVLRGTACVLRWRLVNTQAPRRGTGAPPPGFFHLPDIACERCPQGEIRHRVLPGTPDQSRAPGGERGSFQDIMQELAISSEGTITARPHDDDYKERGK